jgi:hypothetical protein
MQKIAFILLWLSCFPIIAQEINASLFLKTPLDAEIFIGVDDFQNLYYINNNILYKQTKHKIFSYSNVSLGKIAMVNIQNSFKLIVFYADFNAVMILDNNLNELSEKIDFTKETLFNNVLFVTGSSQNNLWLYADDNKLHLYDYKNLAEKNQTQPITFYEENFNPKTIISTYKKVWVLSDTGVLQFNEYGIYIDSFEKSEIDFIFPFQKGYIFYQTDSFYYQKGKETIPVVLKHDQLAKAISITNSLINIYDGNFVYQYELKI